MAMFSALSLFSVIIFLNQFSISLCDDFPAASYQEILSQQPQQSPGLRYLKLIDLRLGPNSALESPKLEEIFNHEEGIDVRSGPIVNGDLKNQNDIQFQQIADKLKEIAVAVKEINTEIVKLNSSVSQLKNEISRKSTNSISARLRNCKEIYDAGQRTLYPEILPELSKEPFLVFCDMKTRGGGWTVIQSRFNGSVNFNRSWQDYKTGFGDPHGEFWLGLDHIYELIGSQAKELYIELEEKYGDTAYAYFEEFKIAPEEDSYRLITLKGYSGTAGNSLDNHIGMKFSTFDRDQDIFPEEHCAQKYGGGWWFKRCYNSHLNGIYRYSATSTGIAWEIFGGVYHSLAKSRMMIR